MDTGDLKTRIVQIIARQGPLSVAQFMTIALHDPKAGYYATRDPLGQDFTTAPEVSQTFGELLGIWCVQAWRDQGEPVPARLVELGPGRGTLMADALRAAKIVPDFLSAIEVVLVENSPVLAGVQGDALRDCGVPVRWASSISDLEYDRPTFIIANEFFDALPVEQYVFTETGWFERMISADENGVLSFVLAPAPRMPVIAAGRGTPSQGAVYEFSPSSCALVDDIAHGVASAGGACLIVDYGHAGAGFGDTLQAVGKNAFQSLLSEPGAVDISAHVDFGMIAGVARSAGAAVCGPVKQGDFLTALGIRERHEQLRASTTDSASSAGIERLIDPRQMGSLFKALAILPKGAPAPAGFIA